MVLQRDELGYSALHHAAIAGLRDMAELLVEVGEDVDAKGQDGATPLRCAVQEGHQQLVESLLARGASFLDRDEDGLTMLHCAAAEGHQAVVSIILTQARVVTNYSNYLHHCDQIVLFRIHTRSFTRIQKLYKTKTIRAVKMI